MNLRLSPNKQVRVFHIDSLLDSESELMLKSEEDILTEKLEDSIDVFIANEGRY